MATPPCGVPFSRRGLRATLDYVRALNPTIAAFNTMEPRPGTDLCAHPETYGITHLSYRSHRMIERIRSTCGRLMCFCLV